MTSPIVLTSVERLELARRARRQAQAASDARRARLILLLADGISWDEIQERLECSRGFIATWCRRFAEQRTAGLNGRHIGQVSRVLTPALEARILKCKDHPRRGKTRWTSRSLAEHLHVSHMTVARVWREHGQDPRRLDRRKRPRKPGSASGTIVILALYLDPSVHAAVFGVVEEAAANAREGKGPVQRSRSRIERDGDGDCAPGVRSLNDALATKPGAARGRSSDPHSAVGFEAFLADIVVSQPSSNEIHLIADNFSGDENKQTKEFLSAQQKVRLHLMPTYSSWLKQVELWISRIVRDASDGRVVTPDQAFGRKLLHQIRLYNSSRLTLRWKSAGG